MTLHLVDANPVPPSSESRRRPNAADISTRIYGVSSNRLETNASFDLGDPLAALSTVDLTEVEYRMSGGNITRWRMRMEAQRQRVQREIILHTLHSARYGFRFNP